METTSVNRGMFLKRKENGEILKVTGAGTVIEYEGTDANGQVRADKLHEEFDIVDMSDQDGIEALLKSKIELEIKSNHAAVQKLREKWRAKALQFVELNIAASVKNVEAPAGRVCVVWPEGMPTVAIGK